MDPIQYLTTEEAAARLRLSRRTVEAWRLTGAGPAFVRLGRRVVYPIAKLDEFCAARMCHSTSERPAA